MYEHYCKMDSIEPNGLSHNAFKEMGRKTQITPVILSNQEYLYIHKALSRNKVKASIAPIDQEGTELESTKLSY